MGSTPWESLKALRLRFNDSFTRLPPFPLLSFLNRLHRLESLEIIKPRFCTVYMVKLLTALGTSNIRRLRTLVLGFERLPSDDLSSYILEIEKFLNLPNESYSRDEVSFSHRTFWKFPDLEVFETPVSEEEKDTPFWKDVQKIAQMRGVMLRRTLGRQMVPFVWVWVKILEEPPLLMGRTEWVYSRKSLLL
ncbi:hypothetical protein HDU67_007657 [Dinochytrium kinnereticum]|nr:hypothetical protein HDU67_007657 [Dinochytrium kinnereticum]